MKRIAATLMCFGGLVAMGVKAGESETLNRFLNISRELRVHRAEMLGRFASEAAMNEATVGKGVRVYLRWSSAEGERLRKLQIFF